MKADEGLLGAFCVVEGGGIVNVWRVESCRGSTSTDGA